MVPRRASEEYVSRRNALVCRYVFCEDEAYAYFYCKELRGAARHSPPRRAPRELSFSTRSLGRCPADDFWESYGYWDDDWGPHNVDDVDGCSSLQAHVNHHCDQEEKDYWVCDECHARRGAVGRPRRASRRLAGRAGRLHGVHRRGRGPRIRLLDGPLRVCHGRRDAHQVLDAPRGAERLGARRGGALRAGTGTLPTPPTSASRRSSSRSRTAATSRSAAAGPPSPVAPSRRTWTRTARPSWP